MYTLRAILVSGSVFALVYLLASVAVCRLGKPVATLLHSRSPRQFANLIYGARMSPPVLAGAIVSAFTIPSFLRYEPRVSNEAVGVLPVLLSAGLLAVIVIGAGRALAAYLQMMRWIEVCTAGSAPYAVSAAVRVVSSPHAPPAALAGIRKSTVLISFAARATLTQAELRCAVAHELAHGRGRDNLKKLLMLACPFPGFAALEHAWLRSIEFAADAEAVNSDDEAVELASALVKISRLPSGALPAIATGLVQGPSLIAARVERLLDRDRDVRVNHPPRAVLAAGFGVIALAILWNYGVLLRAAHEVTELLVR